MLSTTDNLQIKITSLERELAYTREIAQGLPSWSSDCTT